MNQRPTRSGARVDRDDQRCSNDYEDAVRGRVMNHLVHDRGQLSVYLRLPGVAVPGMYGPSANEILPRKRARRMGSA